MDFQITTNDHISFDQLYNKYIQLLLVYGLQFTSDRELVKDCIQDVFIKLYETKAQLHLIENMDVYLRISLKNRILNSLKRKKILAKHISTSEFSEIDDFTAEQQLEHSEEEQHNRKLIETILNLLTPQQRKVVHYRFIEGLTLEEISNAMQINYQSVQNILQRSIKKIKKHFFPEN